jgi:hypothetical protein
MVQGEWCYLGWEGEIEWLIGLALGVIQGDLIVELLARMKNMDEEHMKVKLWGKTNRKHQGGDKKDDETTSCWTWHSMAWAC